MECNIIDGQLYINDDERLITDSEILVIKNNEIYYYNLDSISYQNYR